MNAEQKIAKFKRFGSVLGLERIKKLMELLGDPQEELGIIHVAGTNGKGSVCRFIYEALRANGYRAGLYNSPFVEDFSERIEYDGKGIPRDELEICTDRVIEKSRVMMQNGYDSPTEFEILTAVAFLYFSRMKPDLVVMEVGLGGRGDSTNIIKNPLISVITSISHDHGDRLGNTIREIASEKAGIIKSGAPVVINVKREAKILLQEVARQKGSSIFDAGEAKPRILECGPHGSIFDVMLNDTEYKGIKLKMAGRHQIDNALTALAAIEILHKNSIIKVNPEKIRKGMEEAFMKGRFEVIDIGIPCVLDGAHNVDGMAKLTDSIGRFFPDRKPLYVIGMMADKDVDGIISILADSAKDFIATEPDNSRRLKAEILCGKLAEKGAVCHAVPDVTDAFFEAQKRKNRFGLMVFAGSLYMIGDIRKNFGRISDNGK